jgi:hypothetical protein
MIRQHPKGGAIRRRAMISCDQHVRYQAVAVLLYRATQGFHLGIDVSIAAHITQSR